MQKYDVRFFPNGRIYFLDQTLLEEAIQNDQEILVVMNAWSGGYAIAVGANKVPAWWYDDNAKPDDVAYEMYAYYVNETTFCPEEFSKFYRVIFTSGYMVRMKTGDQANAYQGGEFIDWDTSFEKFKQSFRYSGETESEFEKMRRTVDIEATANFMRQTEDRNGKLDSLSHYLPFVGIEKFIK